MRLAKETKAPKDHVLAGSPIDTARIVDALVRRTHAAEVLS